MGYWSEANAQACSVRGICIYAYIQSGRKKQGHFSPSARYPIPVDLDAKCRMARKLRINYGREVYARRKAIVEPVCGYTKDNRGLRCFLL